MRQQTEPCPAEAGEMPFLSAKAVGLAVGLSALLAWPMLVVTAPLGYFDTSAYLQTGQRAVEFAFSLAGSGEAAGPTGEAAAEAAGARQIRSFVYSGFLYLGSIVPGGLVAATMLQTAATLLVLLAFARRDLSLPQAAPGFLFLAAFTTLPWFASYAMPDILAAGVVLFYALLVSRIEAISLAWRWVLCGIAAFAVVSHYGHLPLAAGLAVAVLAYRVIVRNLTFATAVLAVAPIALGAGLHLAASAVALDGPSLAPKRLPILLARSIDDGPAARYLNAACPDAGYTICRVFPEGIPADITTFLWSKDGVARATAAEMNAIRAEEWRILWNAFLAYPLDQTRALAGNFLRQLASVGTGHVNPLLPGETAGSYVSTEKLRDSYPALELFDSISAWGTAAALLLSLWLWLSGAFPRGATAVLVLCLVGLAGNAFIFGGLSAPVDRYQSRLVWILPALALVFWANGRGRRSALKEA